MGSNKLVQAGAYTWFLFKNPSIVFCMEDHVQREWWMSTENIAFPSRKTQEEAHTAFLDVMRKAGYTLVFLDGSIERLESKDVLQPKNQIVVCVTSTSTSKGVHNERAIRAVRQRGWR